MLLQEEERVAGAPCRRHTGVDSGQGSATRQPALQSKGPRRWAGEISDPSAHDAAMLTFNSSLQRDFRFKHWRNPPQGTELQRTHSPAGSGRPWPLWRLSLERWMFWILPTSDWAGKPCGLSSLWCAPAAGTYALNSKLSTVRRWEVLSFISLTHPICNFRFNSKTRTSLLPSSAKSFSYNYRVIGVSDTLPKQPRIPEAIF